MKNRDVDGGISYLDEAEKCDQIVNGGISDPTMNFEDMMLRHYFGGGEINMTGLQDRDVDEGKSGHKDAEYCDQAVNGGMSDPTRNVDNMTLRNSEWGNERPGQSL